MISYACSWTLFLFFLTLSHAIIIKQLNRNRCETGSVSINNLSLAVSYKNA